MDSPLVPYNPFEHLASFGRNLKVADIAPILGISEKTVYRLAGKGVIPCFKVGGSLRFAPAEISKYLRSVA